MQRLSASSTGQSDVFERDELFGAYRLFAAIAGSLIPLFWVVYRLTDPTGFDPLWLRLLLASLCFGVLRVSYVDSIADRWFVPLTRVLMYVVTGWFIAVSAANAFSPNYTVGLLFVISATAVAISTGLQRTAPMTAFLVYAAAVTAGVALLVPEEASGDVNDFIFAGCVVSLALVIFVAARASIRARAQLSVSEEKYRKLFDSASDAILVVDPERAHILEANATARALYGYEEMTGMTVDQLASDRTWIERVPSTDVQADHRRRDGTPIHLLVSTKEIDFDGRPAYMAVNRDVTERIRTMETLSHANAALRQRNLDLQDFTTAASHDLKEPVRKIRTFADLVEYEYGPQLDAKGREYLRRMQEIGHQMSRIITDLLSFSRVTSDYEPFRTVDLTKLARLALQDLSEEIEEAGADVEVGELPSAEVAAMQIQDLLRQLVANALEAGTEGCPVRIRISGAVEEGPNGAICRMEVADNGTGIDDKYLDKIFSPFRQLATPRPLGRTGMGLAICKRIAEHHGGGISVRSRPGSGSTFVVELPRTQPRADV